MLGSDLTEIYLGSPVSLSRQHGHSFNCTVTKGVYFSFQTAGFNVVLSMNASDL